MLSSNVRNKVNFDDGDGSNVCLIFFFFSFLKVNQDYCALFVEFFSRLSIDYISFFAS